MEEAFLGNLVLLVQKNSLNWKLTPKNSFDKEDESSISTIGPDNKTFLTIKFKKDEINFIKVANKDLGIDKLLFRSEFEDYFILIEVVLYPQFKSQIDLLLKKEERSEEEKWNQLTQTFDIQNIREIKLDNILGK